MFHESLSQLAAQLRSLDPAEERYASKFVDCALTTARELGASDVHLQPAPAGLELRLRLNGVLSPVGAFPPGATTSVVGRLKVLADLLTYRTDVPQEGRLRSSDDGLEMRVSTFPTVHGERAVVRLFSSTARYLRLADLGYSSEIERALTELLLSTSGAIVVTGPAGSGKTTTLYALLRELSAMSGGGRSIATLEDPVEVALAGVSQSEVNVAAGFDLPTGLRSILRQDPEVIMVGEVRDRVTAEVALQASLTGQLVLTSFHAGSSAAALSRLADMGIEPYVIRSGVLAVISQRLVRRLCSCAVETKEPETLVGLNISSAKFPQGCDRCAGTGYSGRLLIAEMLRLADPALAQAVLQRADATVLEQIAVQGGMIRLFDRAVQAVEAGLTSPAEVRRVLGFPAVS